MNSLVGFIILITALIAVFAWLTRREATKLKNRSDEEWRDSQW